jgi:hypothetical protein
VGHMALQHSGYPLGFFFTIDLQRALVRVRRLPPSQRAYRPNLPRFRSNSGHSMRASLPTKPQTAKPGEVSLRLTRLSPIL